MRPGWIPGRGSVFMLRSFLHTSSTHLGFGDEDKGSNRGPRSHGRGLVRGGVLLKDSQEGCSLCPAPASIQAVNCH